MQKNYFKTLLFQKIVRNAVTALICLCSVYGVNAQEQQTVTEKRVDYLERIYFSGENKEGLNGKILVAIQELRERTPTPALAKQATFLIDIQDKASAADNACDILDLLAVGIYNIDAVDGSKQGVKTPSNKAKETSVDALSSLNKLNTTSGNLSASARNLGWSSYLLSGGKASSVLSGAGKVANTAGAISDVAGIAGQAGKTAQQITDIGKSFGIGFKKKDKACNVVTKKDIEIGDHSVQSTGTTANANATVNTNSFASNNTVTSTTGNNAVTSTTVINIPGIGSPSLRALADTLRTKAGVQSAEKAYNESLSTITVVHTGSTDALADWLEDKLSSRFKLVNYANGKINLAPKK